jgi:hypothetical protein
MHGVLLPGVVVLGTELDGLLVEPGVPCGLEGLGVVPGSEELLFTAEQGGKLLGVCAPVAGLVCVGLPVGLPVAPGCPEGDVCDGLV